MVKDIRALDKYLVSRGGVENLDKDTALFLFVNRKKSFIF
jgi:hypothetical protein